jgi:uncharacterized cysteine cluster protein YcgN (CxxCxxCC family)
MKDATENSSKDWDSICSKCGRCCYEKIDFEGKIYYTELPCEFLDLATKTCRVYAERDVKRPGCVRLTKESVKKGFLPADCPYVAGVENYTAPTLSDDGEFEDL